MEAMEAHLQEACWACVLTWTPTRTSDVPRQHRADPLHCCSTPRARRRGRTSLQERPSLRKFSWKPCTMYSLSCLPGIAVCLPNLSARSEAKNRQANHAIS